MKLPVMAPEHLTQLREFEKKVLANHAKIEAWFRSHWNEHRPPFYGSVDIRNAGYKISSIDMNLFPGGFRATHSICKTFTPSARFCVRQGMKCAWAA